MPSPCWKITFWYIYHDWGLKDFINDIDHGFADGKVLYKTEVVKGIIFENTVKWVNDFSELMGPFWTNEWWQSSQFFIFSGNSLLLILGHFKYCPFKVFLFADIVPIFYFLLSFPSWCIVLATYCLLWFGNDIFSTWF